MSIATERIRNAIREAENGGIGNAVALSSLLKQYGFVGGMHVGKDAKDFDAQMIVEWYLGQGIDMIDNAGWIGMNSWFNCMDKFLPAHFEFTTKSHLSEDLFTID